MLSLGGGYTVYLIMKFPYSSLCAFWQLPPYFLFNFCKLFFILVFVEFFKDFSNGIRERIILEYFQH